MIVAVEMWEKRQLGLDVALERGFKMSAIARSIGTTSSNLGNMMRRKAANSRYLARLDRWLEANIFSHNPDARPPVPRTRPVFRDHVEPASMREGPPPYEHLVRVGSPASNAVATSFPAALSKAQTTLLMRAAAKDRALAEECANLQEHLDEIIEELKTIEQQAESLIRRAEQVVAESIPPAPSNTPPWARREFAKHENKEPEM